jgi:hypothetical protein
MSDFYSLTYILLLHTFNLCIYFFQSQSLLRVQTERTDRVYILCQQNVGTILEITYFYCCPAPNGPAILKSMSDFYVTDICTSDLSFFQILKSVSNSQIYVLFQKCGNYFGDNVLLFNLWIIYFQFQSFLRVQTTDDFIYGANGMWEIFWRYFSFIYDNNASYHH